MGVSLYVMPLGIYLRGDFKTTWEIGTESGSEDPRRVPSRDEGEVHVALAAFRKRLSTFIVSPLDWDEESDFRHASTMGYGSFGRPCERARQWAYQVQLPRLQVLVPPQIWLPVPFEPTVRAAAPWDPDLEIGVVSSRGLDSEFGRLSALLEKDPRAEELRSLSPGSILSGPLAEFDGERSTLRHLRKIAGMSIEHRVPVIVEG
jgi:hypothetical protein